MKTILCYGDSNTWGYNPSTRSRYEKEKRWPDILQEELGNEFEVIAEGLNGRTTVWDDPIEGEYKNGKSYLLPCLHSHKPIDIVIVYLGANDFKYRFSVTSFDVAKAVEALVKIIKGSGTGNEEGKSPEVIVVVPTAIGKLSEAKGAYMEAKEKSKDVSEQFKKVFGDSSFYLLDSNEIIKTSEVDGVHLSEESHYVLGKEISKKIKAIFFRDSI